VEKPDSDCRRVRPRRQDERLPARERARLIRETPQEHPRRDPYLGSPHWYVELKRTDSSTTVLLIVWRMLPRNGGRALFLLCPFCNTPRRHVYGWERDSVAGWSNGVRQISWRCRSCARLRYSSEGGYLRPACGRLGQLGALLRASWGNLPRPASWLPYVLPSIDDPRLDELLGYSHYPRPSSDRGLVDSTSTSTSRSENPN